MKARGVLRVAAVLVVAGGLTGAALLVLPHVQGRGAVPKPLATIVLDAGSGGYDPGAVYAGVEEEDINLAIAQRVQALAEADGRLHVVMTRTADMYMSLEARVAKANYVRPALYLSIQANASGQHPEATGVETLVAPATASGSPSWQLAELVQGRVIAATGARDRGVKKQELYIGRIAFPAALIETGFLSNAQERAMLQTAAYQEKVASGILNGILAYLEYTNPSFAARADSHAGRSSRNR
ncbi:MAG: N-acetylmuramoyl-L-alanine amidase [Candidatus Bipolaricaulia bacterium]